MERESKHDKPEYMWLVVRVADIYGVVRPYWYANSSSTCTSMTCGDRDLALTYTVSRRTMSMRWKSDLLSHTDSSGLAANYVYLRILYAYGGISALCKEQGQPLP